MLAGDDEINPYLQQEVYSASPPRLRYLLIRRAHELCGMVDRLWANQEFSQAAQWTLRISEILGELLAGVQDANHPLSGPISDFYVFLLQLAQEVDRSHDRQRLQVLQELLAIEAETWLQFLEKLGRDANQDTDSLPAPRTSAAFPIILPDAAHTADGGSFSLEM